MTKRGPVKRKGAPTSVRFDTEIEAKLRESARLAGRSFGEEVNARLKGSFSAIDFGVPESKGLAYAIGLALEHERSATGLHWFQDPWAFQRTKKAIDEVLTFFDPGGDADMVPTDARPLQRLRSLGLEGLVENAAQQLKDHDLGRRSGQWAIVKLKAAAGGRISRLDELRPIAEVVTEMLNENGQSDGAMAKLIDSPGELVKAYLRDRETKDGNNS